MTCKLVTIVHQQLNFTDSTNMSFSFPCFVNITDANKPQQLVVLIYKADICRNKLICSNTKTPGTENVIIIVIKQCQHKHI